MLDHFFPLLFHKDSKSLKILDIQLLEVGAKRPLNSTSKVNRQTNRQTDGQTHRWTFRLIESIGPARPGLADALKILIYVLLYHHGELKF